MSFGNKILGILGKLASVIPLRFLQTPLLESKQPPLLSRVEIFRAARTEKKRALFSMVVCTLTHIYIYTCMHMVPPIHIYIYVTFLYTYMFIYVYANFVLNLKPETRKMWKTITFS